MFLRNSRGSLGKGWKVLQSERVAGKGLFEALVGALIVVICCVLKLVAVSDRSTIFMNHWENLSAKQEVEGVMCRMRLGQMSAAIQKRKRRGCLYISSRENLSVTRTENFGE
jgi:hypothetical protein